MEELLIIRITLTNKALVREFPGCSVEELEHKAGNVSHEMLPLRCSNTINSSMAPRARVGKFLGDSIPLLG